MPHLDHIKEKVNKMDANVTALVAAVASVNATLATVATDVAAVVARPVGIDAEDTAAIVQASADLTSITNQLTDIDTKLKGSLPAPVVVAPSA